MLKRLERSPGHLVVESVRKGGWRALALCLAIGSCIYLGVLAELYAVSRLVGHSLGEVLSSQGSLPILLAGPVLLVLSLPWILMGRERLAAAGADVEYEKWAGPFRLSRRRFDLLAMHGLRYEREPPAASPLSRSLAFWHKDEAFWFGGTLAQPEILKVVEALLAYDSEMRRSLDMDTTKGLRDLSVWTPDRLPKYFGELDTSNRRGNWL